MDVFEAIMERRSCRDFKARPVEKDDLLLLTEMGMNAPTSGNLQDIKFILSQEKKHINALPELCMDQFWISGATGLIVICSQPEKQGEWYGDRGRIVFTAQNAAAATQNILLAAHNLSIGACWIGGFDHDRVASLFDVPKSARVEVIIALGYPYTAPDEKVKVSMKSSVFFDSYGNEKRDPALTNKDYSLKIDQHIAQTKEDSKNFANKAKDFFDKVNEHIKPSKSKNDDPTKNVRP